MIIEADLANRSHLIVGLDHSSDPLAYLGIPLTRAMRMNAEPAKHILVLIGKFYGVFKIRHIRGWDHKMRNPGRARCREHGLAIFVEGGILKMAVSIEQQERDNASMPSGNSVDT